MRKLLSRPFAALLAAACASLVATAHAAPPVPSGPHPRLFMRPSDITGYAANTASPLSSTAKFMSRCQETILRAKDYEERGGVDGDNWPGAAISCAFAYRVTKQSKFLTQALTYWRAALNDDQRVGDNLGCTAAKATADWKKWNGEGPAPPALLTTMHDTGYPIRWYGPYVALTYDWLYDAPGVDEALRSQTRSCLTSWVDYYTAKGYLRDKAGFNYHAGFVIAKTLAAVAIGNDGGADGHLWTETLRDVFAKTLVGEGLANRAGGAPGVLVGGDWGSWQYGPLSVVEYAAATRAVEENGAPQPEMDEWVSSLVIRSIHGMLPKRDSQFFGNGDFESEDVYKGLDANQIDAVLLGPSTEQAASWALFERQQRKLGGGYFWNALAELRNVKPQDYRAKTPPAPLYHFTPGLGNLYSRTSWDDKAFWAVFMSGSPNGDHPHFAASNFVFSRGGDHLIVDSSNYGEPSTLETNAITADSAITPGNYALTQGPWGAATMPWIRATTSAYAARSDFARTFDYNGKATDIRYAHREWVMLHEGEIVAIDRVHTSAPSRNMYVNFHTDTRGTLALDDKAGVAVGTVGNSRVAIHRVHSPGAVPKIVRIAKGGCKVNCSYPCGACAAARFDVDEYSLTVPGPWAVAVHVIDGLGRDEPPATTASLNDDTVDPAPKQNGGVIGASIVRGSKQSYVVASGAVDGVAGAMTYGVPGDTPSRHIVYDAAEASDGTSQVAGSAQAGRCVVKISAGSGGGVPGRPLAFNMGSAKEGCTVNASEEPPARAMVTPHQTSPAGGCGCKKALMTRQGSFFFPTAFALVLFARRRRR